MKKNQIILNLTIFFILTHYLLGQDISSRFSEAMTEYKEGNFAAAYKSFSEICDLSFVVEKIVSTSQFYTGECLYLLKEFDGAISEYEKFVNDYETSNFVDLALYRLGTIYFDNGKYNQARQRLQRLLKDYKSSD